MIADPIEPPVLAPPWPLGSMLGDPELAITVQPLGQGRRRLTLLMGRLGTVRVLESPAPALTAAEWDCIVAARASYRHMWGGSDKVADTRDDPFDGCGAFAYRYRTIHYIATIVTPGKPDKIITMRKVAIHPAALDPAASTDLPALVEDVGFWEVHDAASGTTQPLGTVLHAYLERERGLGRYPSPAHLPLAALSRSGTLPYEHTPDRRPDDRNRTAVAYALIQVAALAGDTTTALYMAQICEEFRTRAFALALPDGRRVELDYPPTARVLGLPAEGTVVRLDRANPLIQHLLADVPGFWLDNAALAHLLADMLAAGRLGGADFVPAAAALLVSPDAPRLKPAETVLLQRLLGHDALAPAELQEVARLLTKPRLAKYLIGLVHTHNELARRLLADVPDGPYSATLDPMTYGRSVLHLLHAAQALYAGQLRSVMEEA